MDDKFTVLCQFLEKQYQEAEFRYLYAFIEDKMDYTARYNIRNTWANAIFLGYIEVFGDSGEGKARQVLDTRKEAAWKQFVDTMIKKYNLPEDTWKQLYQTDAQEFWALFDKSREATN